jgi:hypothetical protein
MNGIGIKTLKEIEVEFGDFEIKQVWGGSNDIYLRFGYWSRVDVVKLQQIIGNLANVVEDDDYDDDCGWLFSYKLK